MAELAQQIGVPPDNLVDTVRRFNELAGRDDDEDFGRGRESFDRAFTGGASPLVPIDTPPYRAAAFGISDLGTKGGLRTDVDARVLGGDDRPIPGLYAAGNTMAAVSGTTYPGGGNPIGASLLFSHRAAMHMASKGESEELHWFSYSRDRTVTPPELSPRVSRACVTRGNRPCPGSTLLNSQLSSTPATSMKPPPRSRPASPTPPPKPPRRDD